MRSNVPFSTARTLGGLDTHIETYLRMEKDRIKRDPSRAKVYVLQSNPTEEARAAMFIHLQIKKGNLEYDKQGAARLVDRLHVWMAPSAKRNETEAFASVAILAEMAKREPEILTSNIVNTAAVIYASIPNRKMFGDAAYPLCARGFEYMLETHADLLKRKTLAIMIDALCNKSSNFRGANPTDIPANPYEISYTEAINTYLALAAARPDLVRNEDMEKLKTIVSPEQEYHATAVHHAMRKLVAIKPKLATEELRDYWFVCGGMSSDLQERIGAMRGLEEVVRQNPRLATSALVAQVTALAGIDGSRVVQATAWHTVNTAINMAPKSATEKLFDTAIAATATTRYGNVAEQLWHVINSYAVARPKFLTTGRVQRLKDIPVISDANAAAIQQMAMLNIAQLTRTNGPAPMLSSTPRYPLIGGCVPTPQSVMARLTA